MTNSTFILFPLASTAMIVTYATLALLGITVSLFLLLIVLRIVVRRRELKTESKKEAIRPLVYELLTSDDSPEEVAKRFAADVPRSNYPELEKVLLENARTLKGREMNILSVAFERLGFVDEDIKNLQRGRMLKKAEAAFHLGTMRTDRAVPFLTRALQNRSQEVVFSCLNSLSKIGTPDAIEAIVAYLSASPDIATLRVAEVVLESKQSFSPYLLEWLEKSGQAQYRASGIISLIGAMKDEQAVPLLLRYLSNPDPEVRSAAAEALGRIGDFIACDTLSKAMDDEDHGVRAKTAEALGRIQCDGAIGKLAEKLSDSYLEVKMNCAVALTQLGEEGRRTLESALSVEEEVERGVAAEALQKDKLDKD